MTALAQPISIANQRITFEEVSWDYYQQTLDQIGDGHLRVTYDNGRMELMSPSQRHEQIKTLIGRLIEIYALEADISILPLGSVTCRRKDLKKGLEPDECYYVTNRPRDLQRFNLRKDPPPDLAIEVDITHSSVPREPIYAALGVPEVWRFDGNQVTPLHRDADGEYRAAARSLAFPHLSMALFNEFFNQALVGDQHSAMKAFRDWARTQG